MINATTNNSDLNKTASNPLDSKVKKEELVSVEKKIGDSSTLGNVKPNPVSENKPTVPTPPKPAGFNMSSANLSEKPPESDNKDYKPKKKFNIKMVVGAIILLLIVVGSGAGFYLSQQTQDIRQQAAAPSDEDACNAAGCAKKNYEWKWDKSIQECKQRLNKDCSGDTSGSTSNSSSNNGDGTYTESVVIEGGKTGNTTFCGTAPTSGCNANICMSSDLIVKSCALTNGGTCFKKTGTCDNNCLDGECKLPPPSGDPVGPCKGPSENDCNKNRSLCHWSTSANACLINKVCADYPIETCDNSTNIGGPSCHWTEGFGCKDTIETCTAQGWDPFSVGCCPTSGPDICNNPGSFICIDDPFVSECKPIRESHIPECEGYGADNVWVQVERYKTVEELYADPRCNESTPTPTPPPTSTPTPPPGEPICRDVAILDENNQVLNVATTPFSMGMILKFRCAADDPNNQVTNYEFQVTEPDGSIISGIQINPIGSSAISLNYQIDQYLDHQVECRACTGSGCQGWQTIN